MPAAVLMVPFAYWILSWLFPPEIPRLPVTVDEIRLRLHRAGSPSRIERVTLAIFLGVIVNWVLTPLVGRWSGGRIALTHRGGRAGRRRVLLPARHEGAHVEGRGARDRMGRPACSSSPGWRSARRLRVGRRALAGVGPARRHPRVPGLLQPFVIVLAVAGLHMMFSSNTVTASIIVPILVALAADLRLDMWMLVAPAAFTSSLAFILVSEGPTTIIPHVLGLFFDQGHGQGRNPDDHCRRCCVALTVQVVRALLSPSA